MSKSIHLVIDGDSQSCCFEKTIIGYDEEMETYSFELEVSINGTKYTAQHNVMEFAIIDLQKNLPQNMKIACCQTCRHGSFCPFGDQEDEIFCLIDYSPQNKEDVVDIFSRRNSGNNALRPNSLLHKCEYYQEINNSYYSYNYNDWLYYLKDNGEL